jgi:hypothetical protein
VDGRRLGWGACLTGEQQVPGADEHRGERVDVRVRGDAAPVALGGQVAATVP